MNEKQYIKSLIEPLLAAQTALVEDDGTNIKQVEGLIRNRDVALDNLEAAIDGSEGNKKHVDKPVAAKPQEKDKKGK